MRYIHIPEAEQQTDIRHASLFWITGLRNPDQSNRMAAWLLRSPHNPDNPNWRGVRAQAKEGEDPSEKVFYAAGRALGIYPRYVDLVGVIQPGDHPNIKHTTFVYTGFDHAPTDPNPRLLPKPVVGLTLGAFPLNEMPLDEMHPAEAALVPGMLAAAVESGMSPYSMEYFPGKLPDSHVILR